MSSAGRMSTGVPGLDAQLGGGLLPGTLTVVVGASGIGKTQWGLQFAHAGCSQEGRAGVIFDMHARIDPQCHATYAQRMFSWSLREPAALEQSKFADFFAPEREPGDYLHVFEQSGRRVSRGDLDFDGWHDWQAELAAKLATTIAFFYGNFTRGVQRVVVDGVEPAARPSESIQFELFEYVYQQILRKEHDWVARDLFRQHYRAMAVEVERHRYDVERIAAMLFYTSHETLLEALIERPLADGDLLANANTLIYLGKLRRGDALLRGMHIAKHRGSACSDSLLTFRIDDAGLRMEDATV